jgi:hypothetical protein
MIDASACGRGGPACTGGAPRLEDFLPELESLDAAERSRMCAAGREVLEWQRVLARTGHNVVGEVLRGQGEFVEFEHYPRDDVIDAETASQHYYHAHRGAAEHGHFHCFVRAGAIPGDCRPMRPRESVTPWPEGSDAISHLVAISMDAWGAPVGLFATNRWVTDETWYAAPDVIRMLDRFDLTHAWPSWPTNRWLAAMLRLYRPWIAALLEHRDAVIAFHRARRLGEDVLELRDIEVTGFVSIDPAATLKELEEVAA